MSNSTIDAVSKIEDIKIIDHDFNSFIVKFSNKWENIFLDFVRTKGVNLNWADSFGPDDVSSWDEASRRINSGDFVTLQDLNKKYGVSA